MAGVIDDLLHLLHYYQFLFRVSSMHVENIFFYCVLKLANDLRPDDDSVIFSLVRVKSQSQSQSVCFWQNAIYSLLQQISQRIQSER